MAHLQIHHGILFTEVTSLDEMWKQPIQQPSLAEVLQTAQEHERKAKKWKELTKAVTFFLAEDGQPMYMVEKLGFCKMPKAFHG